MADIISVVGASQEAKKYQEQLRFLPYYIMSEVLAQLGISLMQVAGEDIITQMQRRGGLLKPYVSGAAIANEDSVLKVREASLKVETSYISMVDNIKNYVTKKLMNVPMAGTGINQTKKHPFNDLIVSQVIRTATEDVLDALWASERNPAVLSPLGAFDGFDKKTDDLILSGEVAVAEGNQYNTGAIVAPVDENDFTAIEQLVAFIRNANYFNQKGNILYITRTTYRHAVDCLENKYKFKDYDLNGVQEYLNAKSNASIILKPTDFMGKGDRLMLTKPGNLHFGMDTFGDTSFVQVRTPFEDPNQAQFWLQADYGTRIESIDKKEFMINDGTPIANALSGDYQTP